MRDRIDEKIGSLKGYLEENKCPTMEEYRYICGQIRGLKTASAIIDDLATELENKE